MEWAQSLDSLLEWVGAQDKSFIWLFFFISNLAENVFPPWPGDTVTVFGGFLVAQTQELNPSGFGLPGLLTSTLLGNLAGAWVMYKFGHRFLNFVRHKNFPWKEELYSEEKIHNTFQWFHRNFVMVIVLSRFSAGIRFFVSIVAGMIHVNPFVFLGLFTLAVVLWCGLLIFGGYSLGSNWELVLEYLAVYNRFIIVLISGALLAYGIKKYKKKKSSSQ